MSQFIEIFYGMETTPVKDYIDDSFPGEWGTEDKDGNGVKVIRTTNFTNSGKLNLADVVTRSIEDRKVVRKQIKKYDTILERSGGTADNPVGRVVLFEEDNLFLCNNFTQVLRFKDVDPRFAFYALYYFYQTNRTAIRSMGSKTTGIQNLNMSKYLEIGIPNASDEDQKAFVTIAEQADKSKFGDFKSQFIEMFGNPVTNTKGWKTAKIKDVAPEMPSKEQLSGKIWLLNLDMIESNTGRIIEKVYEDVENALSVQSFDEGNVLFSKLRPYLNKVVIPDEPGMATTELVPLRPEPSKLHKVFLSHLLRGNQFVNYANDIAGGTKMPRMPLTELRNFDCILPPMDKQLEFVFIAEQVDKSKFGDFKSQFIEMFENVESYCKLEDLVSDTFPGEWGSEPISENAIKVIRTTNFTNEGYLDLTDVVTRDIEPKKVVRKKLKQGDTILERSGGTKDNPVGRVVFFDEIGDYLPNNFTQVLRPKESVNPVYLFYALYNSYNLNKAAMRAMASQTTGIQNLSMSDFMAKFIVLPSRNEQNKFEQIYRQADKSKSVIQKALVYLNDIQSDELGKIA